MQDSCPQVSKGQEDKLVPLSLSPQNRHPLWGAFRSSSGASTLCPWGRHYLTGGRRLLHQLAQAFQEGAGQSSAFSKSPLERIRLGHYWCGHRATASATLPHPQWCRCLVPALGAGFLLENPLEGEFSQAENACPIEITSTMANKTYIHNANLPNQLRKNVRNEWRPHACAHA